MQDQDYSGINDCLNGDMYGRQTAADYGIFMDCRNARAYDEEYSYTVPGPGRSPNMNNCCGYEYPHPGPCKYPPLNKYVEAAKPFDSSGWQTNIGYPYPPIIENRLIRGPMGGPREKFSDREDCVSQDTKDLLVLFIIALAIHSLLKNEMFGPGTSKMDSALNKMVCMPTPNGALCVGREP